MGNCSRPSSSSSLVDSLISFCSPSGLKDNCNNQSHPNLALKAFSFNDLKTATNNFRTTYSNFGIGSVYKGWIDAEQPQTRMVVDVMRLNLEGFPGNDEWLEKLNTLGQLHHPNLVKIIGYSIGDEHRFLISEFLPKGNLEDQLFNRRVGISPLSWETRMKVAVGVAKGLCFLHNAKSQDFNAKLSTYVSTQIMDIQGYATQGYAVPESIASVYGPGCISTKSDVYSYGVLLLVLLTGRPAVKHTMIGDHYVVDWVKPFRKLLQMMDPRLKGQYPEKAAFTVATLALQCTLRQANSRPELLEVLKKLKIALRPPKCM